MILQQRLKRRDTHGIMAARSSGLGYPSRRSFSMVLAGVSVESWRQTGFLEWMWKMEGGRKRKMEGGRESIL